MTMVTCLAASLLASGTFPPDASPNGKSVDALFWLATDLGAVAFAVVILILAWCAFAFRARPGRKAAYANGETRRARIATGVFAVVVFVGLDVVLAVKDEHVWADMYGDRASLNAGNSLEVQALAKQFEWWFRYAGKDGKYATDDDIVTQVLRVPDDRPTIVRLRSIDVIHSFFLPHWRTKQDAVPGMTTTSVIHPVQGTTGSYEIVCAELCGMGHYRMKGTVKVLSRADFDAWTREEEADIEENGPQGQGSEKEFWDLYMAKSRAGKEKAK